MKIETYEKNSVEDNILEKMNQCLQNIDIPKKQTSRDGYPIIYIVGAPRSGTTILSQVLSAHINVGYINNLIARFWKKPSIGVLLSKRLLKDNGRETISFTSKHGTTSTIGDPHEFGNFWVDLLNLNNSSTHCLSKKHLNDLDGDYIKNKLLHELVSQFCSPVLFKNIICGFQAEFLSKIYPNSLFIFIERNNISTIASILKVRKERLGDIKYWWSLKPKGYPKHILSNNPIDEVAKQVVFSKRQFIEELKKINVKSYYLRYEDFCTNPNKFIKEIALKIENLSKNPIEYRVMEQSLNITDNNINSDLKNKIINSLRSIKGNEKYEYNSNDF